MLTPIRLKAITLLILLACDLTLIAQPKGFTVVKDAAAFEQALTGANGSLKTIASDLTQTQHMLLLKEKIRSKGKFYYSKQDKVRIEYTSPYNYLVVMNNGQLLVKDEHKTSKINTRNSKMMQSVNRIMIDCMNGRVLHNADLKTTAYESGSQYLLMLTPVLPALKKLYSGIDVYMGKNDLDVMKISMTETGGDRTDMEFSNTRRNIPLDETLFKVK